MAYVIRTGSTYSFHSTLDIEVLDVLPVGTYNVGFDEMRGTYFLSPIGSFSLPDKVYGDTEKSGNRILETFKSRPNATGVLLNGVKGSGKTLLAKWISIQAEKANIPTIVINKNYHGDAFNAFIQSIECPSIIMFDEFEKIYNWEDQDKILTLLDGVYPSKKLFLLTSNNDRAINNMMKNRPGRIYYSLDFACLESEFVREYCEDRLDDQSRVTEIVRYAEVFNFFNFDMLTAVVEEMNRYNESLTDVLEVLNVKPEMSGNETYKVSFVIPGEIDIVLDENYQGFAPTQFAYLVDVNDLSCSYVVTSEDNSAAPVATSTSTGSSNGVSLCKELSELPETVLSAMRKLMCNEDIRFTQDNLSKYDADKKHFTYQLTSDNEVFQLVVAKNASATNFNMWSLLA